jgi:hypothetical protein
MPVDAAKDRAIIADYGEPCAHGAHRTRFRHGAKRNRNDLAGRLSDPSLTDAAR